MDTPGYTERTACAVDLPKILLVDDEGDILRSLRRLLRKQFEITTTTLPEEALQHLAEEEYAILLSDQRMPTMEGTELMAKAREVSPDTVRIILTGYADINAAMDAINRGNVYRFLQKPWNDADLLATLCRAVDHFVLVQENKRLYGLTEAQNEKLKAFNRSMQAKVVERTRQVTQLNEELSNTLRETMRVLARMAEIHSPVLGNHAQRVARLSIEVGKQMGFSDEELYQLGVAAMLHDIGKIGMKPGLFRKHYSVLSAEERAILVTHAVTGAALVRMIPNLGEAALFIRHHHERFEGKGFPDRLFGRKIPLGARIIAAVNVYDNALNNRITFSHATPAKARQYVQDCAPRELDPEVVAVLVTILCEEDHEPKQEEFDIEVDIRDLQPGMVLSKNVHNIQGTLVLPRETKISEIQLFRLLKHHQTTPVEGIYVYRS